MKNDQLKQYAQALAELMISEYPSKASKYVSDLNKVILENKIVLKIWESKDIALQTRKQLIFDLIGDGPNYLSSFILLLIEDDLLQQINEILKMALDIIQANDHVKEVVVESATPLTKEQIDKLTKMLKKKTGDKALIKTKVNKELIGGIKITIENDIFDYSIKDKIDDMKTKIKG